uniref:Ribosome maturation factor RimM n=1 Tax=Desulfobacca acetoxidans TaxID=60893 RepID=A0A7C5ETU5_9BACT
MNKRTSSPSRLIPLGRVVGVHGLKGILRVGFSGRPEELDPETFKALGEILLGGEPFRVLRAARGRRHILLGLAGINTREQAETLVGREVQAEAERFPELPPGEYYWFQVLGLSVVHAVTGKVLGTLEEIWPTGAHDVYVVRQGTREILLPAVEEVVREIDLNQGVIRVQPPPGLLELYAD